MTKYITTQQAQLYNNNGGKAEVWAANRPFETGNWVKDGRLFLGPNLPNRWIPQGTYKINEIDPPPPPPVDPPPVTYDDVIHITHYANGVIDRDEWYKKIDGLP